MGDVLFSRAADSEFGPRRKKKVAFAAAPPPRNKDGSVKNIYTKSEKLTPLPKGPSADVPDTRQR
jgi:hypothetical protein